MMLLMLPGHLHAAAQTADALLPAIGPVCVTFFSCARAEALVPPVERAVRHASKPDTRAP
jgi:hypothetical protein